ncbi:golvesin C-terminal-like domain-containing protein [Alistipes ihumii]|uniref:golvesin C-terminal-like domain-containing protein n=1 Tax=Alistipes ihumii TaxID=1470347 RepID=UPI003F58BA5A
MERLLRDPLADGSRPDIFVDNRDASSVVVNGEWETVVNPWRAYGPDYLSDRSAGALPKSVRYVPEIVSEGLYDVYLYVPKIPGGSSLLPVTVYDGKESSRTCIRAGEIVVTGQTGGEWVRVGRYRFSAGNRGYVEVSNKGADGTVVADAVLLVHADSGDR